MASPACGHAFCLKAERRRWQKEEEKLKKSLQPIGHYLGDSWKKEYYVCRFCNAEIKNSYFKYLRHSNVCAKRLR